MKVNSCAIVNSQEWKRDRAGNGSAGSLFFVIPNLFSLFFIPYSFIRDFYLPKEQRPPGKEQE